MNSSFPSYILLLFIGKVGEIQSMLCLSTSSSEDLTFSGSMSGQIYVWKSQNLVKIVEAHKVL